MNELSKNNNKTNLLLFTFLTYYLAVLLLPIVQQVITVYVQILAVTVCVMLVFWCRESQPKMLAISLSFTLYVLLEAFYNISYGDGSVYNFIKTFYDLVTLLLPILVACYLLQVGDNKVIKMLIYVSFGFLLITSITSIIGLQSNPLASKMMAALKDKEDANLVYFNMRNIGGFLIAYTSPLVLPMIFACFKQKKISFILLLVIIVPITVYVVMTQYALALLTLILSYLSLFMPKVFSYKRFIFTLVLGIAAFFILRASIADFFYYIADNTNSTMITERFTAIADTLVGVRNNSDVLVTRESVYMESINNFIEHPFIGSFLYKSGGSGGHSFILDALAKYGIMGLISLLLIYGQIISKLYKPFKNERYYGYMLWTFIEAFLLAVLNPKSNFLVVAFIAPLIAYLIREKRDHVLTEITQ